MLLCVLAAGISGLGFVSPLTSTVLSSTFAASLIFWANPSGLPALAILWIQAVDFGGAAYEPEQQFVNAVFIAGSPLTLQLITLFAITIRSLFEWCIHSQTFGHSRWILRSFMLWLLFFQITIISALWGRSLGNQNWTQPLRASMSLVALFYGIILTAKIKRVPWVAGWLLRIAAVVLVLVVTGLYWNHIAFFYVPLAACAFWYAVRQKRLSLAVVCGAAPITIAYSTGDTFTLMASTLLGLVIGFWLFRSNKSVGRSVTSRWTRLVLPVSILLSLVVLFSTYLPAYDTSSETSLTDRFLFKLYTDRGVLWRAAWTKVIENPEVVSPAGGSLLIYSPMRLQGYLWNVHVHNSYLEMLRQTGILGGVIFLILVIRFWLKLRSALLDSVIPIERVFAGAVLITVLVGATGGMYPFDFFVGPWVWLWAGIAIGLSQSKRATNPAVSISRPATIVAQRIPVNRDLGGQGGYRHKILD